MNLFYLVAKETQAVGLVGGIGKNVDDGAAKGELARGRYKVHLLKSFFLQAHPDAVVGNFLPFPDAEKGVLQFLGAGYLFLHRLRIGDDEQLFGGLPTQ